MARLNNYILLFITNVFCYGCNKIADDNRLLLDYSFHSGWTHSYSLKVYANHRAYLIKSVSGVNSLYINNQINTKDLEEIIGKLSESTVHKKYEDTHIQDALSFNAIVYYGKDKASIYNVYGNKYPGLLNAI
ncbi:hypothetical protein A0256_03420 [Mucilaginibacter sp. PAMC 26640]|nr:hypothetical protein A0256_03420 [Mucilaginibacter sp. PAMC 26640]